MLTLHQYVGIIILSVSEMTYEKIAILYVQHIHGTMIRKMFLFFIIYFSFMFYGLVYSQINC